YMPYIARNKACKDCGLGNQPTRVRRSVWNGKNAKLLFTNVCKKCETEATKRHQENNRERWREYNKKAYAKRVGGVKKNMNRTPEQEA
ncbi:hypothetical protein SL617_30625, partial [Klebsiella michiganensis]|uniref:hypothetical protein n=1 Tax=Klebsiella michiganensis TaxID=1134687 RepID=UPI00386259D2